MAISTLFCLQGSGYLRDLIQRQVGKQTRWFAHIEMRTCLDISSRRRDVVCLECEIEDERCRARLAALLPLVKVEGIEVVLTLSAEYALLEAVYAGQTASDPSQFVTIRARLQALENCSVNGRLAMDYNHCKR